MPFSIPSLQGALVTLRLLKESDSDALVEAARDGELWQLPFTVVPSETTVQSYIAKALQGFEAGTVLPFAVTLAASGKVIGSTRFWKIDRENRKVEIGHTWYAKSWQRTGVNTECKALMLKHAFEELQCIRVQFTTDVLNERSHEAILRLGAVHEGTIRNERIMPNGRKRTSLRFSIIDEEWPEVRNKLMARLEHSRNTA